MKISLNYLTATLVLGLGGLAHAAAPVTGQWDFNSGDLSATVGTPLAYLGAPATTFSTVTIAGQPAQVMGFPACTSSEGYIMTHGIAPNGGWGPADGVNPDHLATNVNQYTLIFDIMWPAASHATWRTFLQTDTGNTADATLFVKNNAQSGVGNYGVYHGSLLPDTWHRVAFVVDLSTNVMYYTNALGQTTNLSKYIDGQYVGSQGYPIGGLRFDGTFSLKATALLFTDNDGDTRSGFVNSIQIRNGVLTPQEILNLGTPTAAGIPTNIPAGPVAVTVSPASATDVVGMASHPFNAVATLGSGTYTYQWYKNGAAVSGQTNAALRLPYLQTTDAGNYTVVVNDGFYLVTNSPAAVLTVNPAPATQIAGQWDFNQTTNATYGQALAETNPSGQEYGTTTALAISDIAGVPANVMYYYANSQDGYLITHGIAPNGGGTNVNQYTLIMDVNFPFVTGWNSLWQTDPLNSFGDDGDIFLFNGALGISGSYVGTVTENAWHRIVFAVDLTKGELGKYIDGTNVVVGASTLHDAQSVGGVDSRWSLQSTARLLADNDFEVSSAYVSSVQIRSGRMTDADIATMGVPSAYKIPGLIRATRSGSNIVVDWTGTVLRSAPSVTGPWTVVPGAAHPHTVVSPTGNLFFKAAQQ